MVQSILEHVVSAIPAAGPKVLPMAKVLSKNLVNGSCDLQTAKQNGQSAIDFLSKLSSIIALNVPAAVEDLQSLQWKDLPLIPVVDEIRKPSKFEQSNKVSWSLGSGTDLHWVVNPTFSNYFVFFSRTLYCTLYGDMSGHYRMLGTCVQWASI